MLFSSFFPLPFFLLFLCGARHILPPSLPTCASPSLLFSDGDVSAAFFFSVVIKHCVCVREKESKQNDDVQRGGQAGVCSRKDRRCGRAPAKAPCRTKKCLLHTPCSRRRCGKETHVGCSHASRTRLEHTPGGGGGAVARTRAVTHACSAVHCKHRPPNKCALCFVVTFFSSFSRPIGRAHRFFTSGQNESCRSAACRPC